MSPSVERSADLQDVRAHVFRLAKDGGIEAALDLLLELLASARGSNDALTARLHTVLRALYGRSSEKTSLEQLMLAFDKVEEPVPDGAKAPPSDSSTPANGDGDKPKAQSRPKGHGRRPLPSLPRETKVVAASPEEGICSACGHARRPDGFQTTSYLEFRPASFFILDVQRQKMACPHCSEPHAVADADAHFDSGRPGPGLISKIIVEKAADGMPVERQSKAILRLGITLSPSTLGEWFSWGCDLLAPVADRLFGLARASAYMQADDTGLKVLDRARKPAVKRGHLWCFVGYDAARSPTVAFRYAPSWEAEHADRLLRGFEGVLQGDGYGGFEAMAGARDDGEDPTLPDARRLGCAMHIRRKFEAAYEAGDLRGAIALGFFRNIYAVEDRVRLASADERLAARQSESLILVDELYAWIASLEPKRVIPGSLLAKATTYARNQEKRWRRCFESGVFFIDNGEPERQIRYPAQGRRAYLFAGSDDGARRLATAYTLVANCRIEGINAWEYLADILEKLAANWPRNRIDELLPRAWKTAREPPTAAPAAPA